MSRRSAALLLALIAAWLVIALLLDRSDPALEDTRSSTAGGASSRVAAEPLLRGRVKSRGEDTPRPMVPPQATAPDAPRIGMLNLDVSGEDGHPLARGSVYVRWWGSEEAAQTSQGRSGSGPAHREDIAIRDGRARIPRLEGLPRMRMWITPYGTAAFEGDPIAERRVQHRRKALVRTDSGRPGKVRIRVTLESAGLIQGRVLDPDGQPVVAANVSVDALEPGGWSALSSRGRGNFGYTSTERGGHFAIGGLNETDVVVVARTWSGVSRRIVRAGTREPIDMVLGHVEGPRVHIEDAYGNPLLVTHPLLRRALPGSAWMPRDPNLHRDYDLAVLRPSGERTQPGSDFALPLSLVGEQVQLMVEVDVGGSSPLDVRWTFRVGEDVSTLRLPRLHEVPVSVVGTPPSRISLRGHGVVQSDLAVRVDVGFAAHVPASGATIRLPAAAYDLTVDTHDWKTAWRREEAKAVVPGPIRLAVDARRDVRVVVKGVDSLDPLEITIDGTQKPGPSAQFLGGGVVLFKRVDPGPRLVTARLRGNTSYREIGLGRNVFPPEGAAPTRGPIGTVTITGTTGELTVVEGHAFVFRLPRALETLQTRDSGVRLYFMARIERRGPRDTREVTGDQVLREGPGGVRVTSILMPGKYDIVIQRAMSVRDPDRVPSLVDIPDAWSFENVDPSQGPLVLSDSARRRNR